MTKLPSKRLAPLEVFIGGACYGANATTYKLAFSAGFSWTQVVAGQMFFALVCFGVILAFDLLRGKRLVRMPPRTAAKLMGLGMLTCGTSILYCFAMTRLPVPLALTLLFQFTWIGLAIQVVTTRRPPKPHELVAVAVILVGTVFASGLYKTGLAGYDPTGLLCACLAAVCCAFFVALSGKVQAPCSPGQRGIVVCAGSLVLSLAVCPTFFSSGVLIEGLVPYGLVTGFFGLMLPTLLYGLGTPYLPAGMSTVLASSELPAGLLVSLLVLGESIDSLQWAGVVAILAGIVVSQHVGVTP